MKKPLYVKQHIQQLKPDQSVDCLRPHVLKRTAKWFISNFPGQVLFPVKTNPDPRVLTTLYEAGIKRFDVASLYEIDLIARLFPRAEQYFMHTVKSRSAIRSAYFDYGIRNFSLDSLAELDKIHEETAFAKDLNLFVRVAVSNGYSEINLGGKFGVTQKEALNLLRQTRLVSSKMGVCFHVGSQCMHPHAFSNAIHQAMELVEQAGVELDVLDLGGGFPAIYPGMEPPPLSNYMDEIRLTLEEYELDETEILCESGRALVAEGASLVVKVDLRKDNMLYINDGVYGSLFDAGMLKFNYPTQMIRLEGEASDTLMPFKFYGPTCDSVDVMEGPFYLPADIAEGDYIEIGQLGAYGRTMQSNFNGFASQLQAEVCDEPLITIFSVYEQANVISGVA